MRNHVFKAITWIWPALVLLGMAYSGCATAPRPNESSKAAVPASPALPQPKADLSRSKTNAPKDTPNDISKDTPKDIPEDTPQVSPPCKQQPKESEKVHEEDKGQNCDAAKGQSQTPPPQELPAPQELPVTLAQCIKIALEQNPVNRAMREGVIEARERVGEATAPFYPELSLSAGYGRWQKYGYLPSGASRPGVSNLIGPTDDWTSVLKARFLLFDSGERGSRRAAAAARNWAAEEDEERVRQDIVLQVHRAYYGLRSAREARSIAGKSLLRAEDHLRLATEKKDAGAAPKVDVIRSQAKVAQAQLAVVRAESLIRIAKGKINVAMGLPVETWIEIAEQLNYDRALQPGCQSMDMAWLPIPVAAEPLLTPSLGSLPGLAETVRPPEEINVYDALDRAVKMRPALKAARLRTAAARREVSAARSAFGPKVRAEGGYGWRGPDFFPDDEEWSAGVSLDWQIFAGFSKKHKLSGTKARLSKEEAEVERLVLEVQEEVWDSYSKLQETYEAIRTCEVLIQDAQESLRLARECYEAGSGPISDLLDTQTALDQAEAERLGANWDYLVARASFQRAIGKLDGREKPDGQKRD